VSGSHARGNLYPCLRFADCTLLAVADLWEVHRTHYRAGANSAWKPPVGELHANNFALQTNENSASFLQGYAGEICEFVESAKANRPPAKATIDDAVEALRVVERLVEQSSGTHAWPRA
jgi:hypothetical protein